MPSLSRVRSLTSTYVASSRQEKEDPSERVMNDSHSYLKSPPMTTRLDEGKRIQRESRKEKKKWKKEMEWKLIDWLIESSEANEGWFNMSFLIFSCLLLHTTRSKWWRMNDFFLFIIYFTFFFSLGLAYDYDWLIHLICWLLSHILLSANYFFFLWLDL